MADFMEHFDADELWCSHCHYLNVHPKLAEGLDAFRNHLNVPLYVNSCCRCEWWNQQVGGSKNSQHLTSAQRPCRACDLWQPQGLVTLQEMVAEALEFAWQENHEYVFNGVGYYPFKGFMHVDVRDSGGVYWVVDQHGNHTYLKREELLRRVT